MKKIFFFLVLALFLFSCGNDQNPQPQPQERFVIKGISYLDTAGDFQFDLTSYTEDRQMLTFPAKYQAELNKGNPVPSYILKLMASQISAESTLQADWAANTLESQVDYTPTPPDAGDVILKGGILDGGIWTQKTSGATGRRGHTAVLYNGKMYVFGGYNGSFLNDVWEYDIAGDSWTQKTSGATGRRGHTAVLYNGKIYIFGGYNGSFLNDVWEYDIAGDSWAQKTSGSNIRAEHTAVAYNGKMYVFGGTNSFNWNAPRKQDVWEYNISGDSWTQKTSGASPREGHSAVVFNGKMYIHGGIYIYDEGGQLPDTWEYNIAGDSWIQKATNTSNPRSQHTAVLISDKMYVFGGNAAADGSDYGSLNTVSEFNITNNTWSAKTSGATGRGGHSAVFYNGVMVVFGGSSSIIDYKNDVWQDLIGYWQSGYIRTKTLDLGSVPTVDGMFRFENLLPSGTSITYEAWASTDPAFPEFGASWSLAQRLGTETGVLSLANLGNGIVIAGTTGGNVYRSVDSGASWTFVQRLGTETAVNSLANLGNGIVIAGTYPTGQIYRSVDSGASWTFVQRLGTETGVNSLVSLDNLKSLAGTSVTGNIYYSENAVTDLGTVVDGQITTVRKRYWRIKATMYANTAFDTTPTLRSVMVRFPTYVAYAMENAGLGYEAALLSVSALNTKIDDFEPCSIGQISATLSFSRSISNYLATKYPKNKEVSIRMGFIAAGYTEADYIDYYTGLIDDWKIGENDEVSLIIKDFSKEWDVPVPAKWQSAGDNKTWTAMHPVDVMLDILRGYVGITDSKIDQSSFNDVKLATPGWVVTRTITGNTIKAKDLLEELRKLLSAYFIPQTSGRIRLKRWDAAEAAVGSLSDNDFLQHTWEANAKALINKTDMYYNHDGDGDDLSDFTAWEIAADSTSIANWAETAAEEFKDKFTLTAQSAQVQARRANILTRYANAPEIIPATVGIRHMKYEAGDIINITTSRAPSSDMAGIVNKPFQIMQKTPDFVKDTISYRLMRRDAA